MEGASANRLGGKDDAAHGLNGLGASRRSVEPIAPPSGADAQALRAIQDIRAIRAVAQQERGLRKLAESQEQSQAARRRQVEHALRESQERYRAIIETANEGICTFDAAGRVTYVNGRMCEMAGRQPEEMLGRKLFELAGSDVGAEFEGHLERRKRGLREQYERHLTRKDGSKLWVMVSSSPLFDDAGTFAGVVHMITDLSDRKRAEEALVQQALHDSLTGLPNRALLRDRLEQALLSAQRERGSLALLLMDLDRFKEINDAFGHQVGDDVLCQIGARLKEVLRAADTVARLGGDEFAIVLPSSGETSYAAGVADKIARSLERPFLVEGQALRVEASIGIALYPRHGSDGPSLLRCSDVAMYVAKRERTGFAIYTSRQDENLSGRLTLIGELRQAIEREELSLFYQPKVHMTTLQIAGVEALVRWRHPARGLLPPGDFIPLAEETGLIKPLSYWVLEEAFRQCAAWHEAGLDVSIAINLSMHDLRDPRLPGAMSSLLERRRVPPGLIKVEITESTIMADPVHTMEVVSELHGMGIAFSIDDFGTGYSSLAYLKHLPAHEIKIDQSFVSDVAVDESDAVIVRSVIEMAHTLGRVVVAEGVENRAIWEVLGNMACDVAQGYLIARPMPAEELERWFSGPGACLSLPARRETGT